MTVEDMAKCRPCIPMTGYRRHRDCDRPDWLRVLIMTQADGCYRDDGSISFNFKKEQKIGRCKSLLRRAEIPFHVNTFEKDGVTRILVPAGAVPLLMQVFALIYK